MPHPCVRASGSGPGLWHQIQWPRVMWLHNPESRPNSASPPNGASATQRHHLMRRYQSGVTSAVRRHHRMWCQQFGVTTQCGFTVRRHHPMRNNAESRPNIRCQRTIRHWTMWRHNSASPKAMRLPDSASGRLPHFPKRPPLISRRMS